MRWRVPIKLDRLISNRRAFVSTNSSPKCKLQRGWHDNADNWPPVIRERKKKSCVAFAQTSSPISNQLLKFVLRRKVGQWVERNFVFLFFEKKKQQRTHSNEWVALERQIYYQRGSDSKKLIEKDFLLVSPSFRAFRLGSLMFHHLFILESGDPFFPAHRQTFAYRVEDKKKFLIDKHERSDPHLAANPVQSGSPKSIFVYRFARETFEPLLPPPHTRPAVIYRESLKSVRIDDRRASKRRSAKCQQGNQIQLESTNREVFMWI